MCKSAWMDKWLDIPKNRNRLPVGRLCIIMALLVLIFLVLAGRKGAVLAELGLSLLGQA